MFELRERLEVTRIEITDILNAILHHSKSGKTETEGKAGVLLGIDAACRKHVGVDHTAGTKLEPARILAGGAALTAAYLAVDIKLKAGLDEREKSRAKSYLDVTLEDLGEHGLHEVDKVGD